MTHSSIKRRILVLTSTFPRWKSDTEPKFVYELCRNYVRNGFKVDVIAPHGAGAQIHEQIEGVNIYRYRYFIERSQTLAYNGGILANLKSNKLNYILIPFFFLFQAVAIIKTIKNKDYDLIHAHWLIPQAFIYVFISKFLLHVKIPMLCTSHGGDLYSLNNLIMKMVKRWTVNNCTHLCVVSRTMKNDCIDLGYPEDRISVLPMGVDLYGLFTPSEEIERYKYRIIFVGRFVEKKGIDILIDAIAQVRVSIPSVELILVGDGPLHNTLMKKVKQLELEDNIKFYGSIENEKLPELYSTANIAVIPSIVDSRGDREGLGLVTVEALGCGCAIAASALGPIKEVVKHGKSGLLFEPGNTQELTTHLISLLQDFSLARKLAETGRQKVKQIFDWKLVTDNYCSLIQKICDKH